MMNAPTDLSAHASGGVKRLDHALTLERIALSRGGHPLFAGISLSIVAGDIVWIGGDNGIGKSSLLRLMTGLSRADSGGICWRIAGADCPPHDLICYQGHQDAFKPNLTAVESLEFWAKILECTASIDVLLKTVGLSVRANVPCGQLSAGQKRRLSLARLMLSQKPVWIMDEPTAAMDSEGVNLIHELIGGHVSRGGSAIIASHQAPRMNGLRTRQLILKATS